MTKRQTLSTLLLLSIVIGSSAYIGWYVGYHRLIIQPNTSSTADIQYVSNLIGSQYYKKIPSSELSIRSIDALIQSLNDPYSFYIDDTSYINYVRESADEFVGIGMRYRYVDKRMHILDALPNSPAQQAGLMQGEEILEINHKGVSTIANEIELTSILRGSVNESITFLIKSPFTETREISLTRAAFKIEEFEYQELPEKIGYLKIFTFGTRIEDEFKPIIEKIHTGKIKKIIIDLRNNGGGKSQSSIYLAMQFLTQGIISTEKFGNGQSLQSKVTSEGPLSSLSVVILVNQDSASAAESFAASLRDNGHAKIIGEKTFGKGVTTATYALPHGGVQLTIGEWFRPNGESVSGKGITPDIEMKDEGDVLMQKAIKELSS